MFVAIIVITSVLSLIPFENLFFTFDSPQVAYKYMSSKRTEPVLVVSGQNCDFVIGQEADAKTYRIIPKTEDGWKLGTGLTTKHVAQTYAYGFYIYTYQYKDTNDYFIELYDPDRKIVELRDEYDSVFIPFEETFFIPSDAGNTPSEMTSVTYYASIPDLDSMYSLTINGKPVFPLSK